MPLFFPFAFWFHAIAPLAGLLRITLSLTAIWKVGCRIVWILSMYSPVTPMCSSTNNKRISSEYFISLMILFPKVSLTKRLYTYTYNLPVCVLSNHTSLKYTCQMHSSKLSFHCSGFQDRPTDCEQVLFPFPHISTGHLNKSPPFTCRIGVLVDNTASVVFPLTFAFP